MTIRINEVLPNATAQGAEWVEIQNTGASSIDLENATISDVDGNTSDGFPAATIAPDEVVVLYDSTNTPPSVPSGVQLIAVDNWPLFAQGNNGDTITVSVVGEDPVTETYPENVGPNESFDFLLNAIQETPTPGVECFLTGTYILTSEGEKRVEDLKIGDWVKTAEGKLVAIKWVAWQTVDPKAPHHPFRSLPIQIKAGALGENLPVRDLFVSPDHAILVDGLLINAGALENGTSIIATQPEATFCYYHIELEKHSLLIAEGTFAESYLPQNQARDSFDNGDEYEELYPEHNILSLLPMSFPRVSSKRQLPRCVAKRLAEVAETLPNCEVGAPA